MFTKGKNAPKTKLTGAEKKQLAAIMAKAKQKKGAQTAQQTIPYQRMFPDGICRVTDTYYSKTLEFFDINYQLAQNEDKEAIFDAWCDILNYFSPSIHFQFSFINSVISEADFEQRIMIPPQDDGFDDLREEYSEMLLNQVSKGNNGLQRAKYLTFGIGADSIKTAKPRLEQIELDLLNHFKQLGVRAEPMDGKARLKTMHGMLHMDDPQAPFLFDWKWLAPTGLSTKDFIAPSGLYFKDGRRFHLGGKLATVSFLQIFAAELDDRILINLLGSEPGKIVTMHCQSLDHVEAIKLVKGKISDLNRSKIDEQKKAVRSGYDIDILPSDLNTYANDFTKVLQDLQNHNERMFLLTFLILHTADSRKELDNIILQTKNIAQEKLCQLVTLDYQQEEGLVSTLPLGLNQVRIQRSMTTSNMAIFMPFITQELLQTSDEALYYGLNALSNNMIMANRKCLKTPNGIILGTPGSGKSFSAKREIENVLIATKDDVMICDPEGEYFPLVQRFKGQVIRISPTSGDYINPFDINTNYSEDHFYTDIEVVDNAKMVVRLFGDEENRFDTAKDICIFDRKAPNVTAGFRELILHVEAADELSGVAGIQVNSLLFTTLVDGKLDICMDESLTVYKQLAIRAYDYAGNFSEPVTQDNPYYNAPTPKPTATPKPTSKPTAKPTKKPSGGNSHANGTSATETPEAVATPAPTQEVVQQQPVFTAPDPYAGLFSYPYSQQAITVEPETVYIPLGPGQPYTGEGNMQTRDMLYSASTNKQFISVQSRAGETYYLVIDYDKPIDADNDIYETYFLNLVDDRDLMNVVSEDELLPTPTPQIVYVTPEPTHDSQPTPIVVEDEDSSGKGSPLLLVIGLAAIGGAVFWWIKSRKNKAATTPDFDEYEFEEDSDEN